MTNYTKKRRKNSQTNNSRNLSKTPLNSPRIGAAIFQRIGMSAPPPSFKKYLERKTKKGILLEERDNSFKMTTFFPYSNNNAFTSGSSIIGGGPLANSKKYSSKFLQNNGEGNESSLTFFDTSIMGDIEFSQKIREFSTNNTFQRNDFLLSGNNTGLNMVNNLVSINSQINGSYFKYVLQNLHILVEIGMIPPLTDSNSNITESKESSSSLKYWIYFHKYQLALDIKCKKKIFTGKTISLIAPLDKNCCDFESQQYPHALDQKLEENLFKSQKKSLNSLKGIAASYDRSFQMARIHVNNPLYFPMKFDNRGRVYYRTEFSPLQRPFGRNLLRFVKPCLIKEGSKEEFIFFGELGYSIKPHSSYKKAVIFVKQNKKEIIASLETFDWTTFSDPWVSLNLILEFKRYFSKTKKERIEGIYLYIQIEIDASSSMLQILSTMILNESISKQVNILPQKKVVKKLTSIRNDKFFIQQVRNIQKSDIYLKVIELFNQKMGKEAQETFISDLAKDLKVEAKDLIFSEDLRKFIFELQRSLVKKILMTKLYNKGNDGLATDIFDALTAIENKKGLINFFIENKEFFKINPKEEKEITAKEAIELNLVVKQSNYISIKIPFEDLNYHSYSSLNKIIQKNKFFLTPNLPTKTKTQNVNGALQIPVIKSSNKKKILEFFDKNYLKESKNLLFFEKQLKKKQKSIDNYSSSETSNDFDEKNKELQEIRAKFESKQLEVSLLALNRCDKIESNFTWICFVYKNLFKQLISESQSLKSLEILKEKIIFLKKGLEEKKELSSYTLLDKDNYISKMEVKSKKIILQYHIDNPEDVKKRSEIFSQLQDLLIKNLKNLQHSTFKGLISKNLNEALQKIFQNEFRDVFIVLEFFSMIAFFVSSKQSPFIVNCFPNAMFHTYYTKPSSKSYYFADTFTKEKKEQIRKRRVKLNSYSHVPDPKKRYKASASNVIQSADGEILRTVISKFVNKYPGRVIWTRHDAFVISPDCYFDIQHFYKEGFYETFFKEPAVCKDSKRDKFFIRKNEDKDSKNNNNNADLNFKKSPLFIFQLLIISNFFNLLDFSESGSIDGFEIKEKDLLKKQNRALKKHLLGFLYDPTLNKLYTFIEEMKGFNTVLTFDQKNVKDLKTRVREFVDEEKTSSINKFTKLKSALEKKRSDLVKKKKDSEDLLLKLNTSIDSNNSNTLFIIKDTVDDFITDKTKCFGSKKSKEQIQRLNHIKIPENKASLATSKKTELQEVLDFLCDKIKQHLNKKIAKADLKLKGTKEPIEVLEGILKDLNDPTKQEKLLPEKENTVKEFLKRQEIARYVKIKSFANEKKSNSQGKLENIFIHYLLIYDKIKESGFDCEKLLLPTRALS